MERCHTVVVQHTLIKPENERLVQFHPWQWWWCYDATLWCSNDVGIKPKKTNERTSKRTATTNEWDTLKVPFGNIVSNHNLSSPVRAIDRGRKKMNEWRQRRIRIMALMVWHHQIPDESPHIQTRPPLSFSFISTSSSSSSLPSLTFTIHSLASKCSSSSSSESSNTRKKSGSSSNTSVHSLSNKTETTMQPNKRKWTKTIYVSVINGNPSLGHHVSFSTCYKTKAMAFLVEVRCV